MNEQYLNANIPVSSSIGGENGRALLHELADMLQQLIDKGEGDSIDLRRIPLFPDDLDVLHEKLGEGEVTAEVTSAGSSVIRESAIPGVWWVTHFNEEDEVIAELIEVTFCPEILKTPTDDARDGLQWLRADLEGPEQTAKGG